MRSKKGKQFSRVYRESEEIFLHAGSGKGIYVKDIIGIFDADTATVSHITKAYIAEADKRKDTEFVGEVLPKSFILYRDGGRYRICFSPISSKALSERI